MLEFIGAVAAVFVVVAVIGFKLAGWFLRLAEEAAGRSREEAYVKVAVKAIVIAALLTGAPLLYWQLRPENPLDDLFSRVLIVLGLGGSPFISGQELCFAMRGWKLFRSAQESGRHGRVVLILSVLSSLMVFMSFLPLLFLAFVFIAL